MTQQQPQFFNKIKDALAHECFTFPAIIFVRTREETQMYANLLSAEYTDVKITHVHSGVPKANRDALLESVKCSETDVVVATDCWMTGINAPSLATVVLAYNGTAPIGLLQRIGRGMRVAGGKTECTVFDAGCDGPIKRMRRAEILQEEGIATPVSDDWKRLQGFMQKQTPTQRMVDVDHDFDGNNDSKQLPQNLWELLFRLFFSPFGLLIIILFAILLVMQ